MRVLHLILLSALLSAPLCRTWAADWPSRVNPAFVAHVSSPTAPASRFSPLAAGPAARRPFGQKPSPVDLSHLAGQDVSRYLARGARISAFSPSALPASYDLRSEGKLPAVRNQGSYGDCWAFATLASVESQLMPGETRDFSENNMTMNSGFDGADPMNEGGTSGMSSAYLLRWSGPVNEADDPHNGVRRTGLTIQKHSQGVVFLPAPDSVNETAFKNNVKTAIQAYGAVYSSIYLDDTAFTLPDYTNFYNPLCDKPYGVSGDNCGCADPGGCGGHAIALVGWNDNFPKANFATTPAGNGAFIARNSWGTGSGESGYFYISYYDTSLGGDTAVFSVNASTSNYTSVYQYDPLGYTYDFGNGDVAGSNSTTEWMANIFMASANGHVRAAGFYTNDINVYYELYVYTGVTAGSPRSGTLAYAASGSKSLPGYHTVEIPSDVLVQSGQRFSVVMKLVNSSYYYPIAVEYPIADYSSGASASPGQSYFSNNGTAWTDLTSLTNSYFDADLSDSNVCLKAYVSADVTPPAAVAAVNDGTGADIDRTGSTSQLSANWPASSDAESGVAAYYYAIGNSPGSANVADWSSNGTALSVTRAGLALASGTTYFFGVRAVNGVGLVSAETWSNGQLADDTSPEDIPYIYDGTGEDIDYVASTAQLSAHWGTSSFFGGTIDRYEYAIGTSPGGAQTAGWTDIGVAYAYTRTGLSLTEGVTYYFSVKAYNNLGNASAAATSDGQVPDVTPATATVLLATPVPVPAGPLSGKLVLTETADRFRQAPSLSFVTASGQAVPLTLTHLVASTWTISGYIESWHSTGTAAFVYSSTDAAGNHGSSIAAGGTFVIDTAVSGIAGGYISSADGNAVLVPAGAYPDALFISISTVSDAAVAGANAASTDSGEVRSISLAREFSAVNPAGGAVSSFDIPVTITMSYPDADDDGRIDGDLLDEAHAWLFYLDPALGKWTPLSGVRRDPSANTVSAEVTHFSIYSVRTLRYSGSGLGSLYAFPNPCRFSSNPGGVTIANIPPDAAGVEIFVYNSAGELVRSLGRENRWDGLDSRGARAATGLYIYLVKSANYSKGRGKLFIVW